MEKIGTFLAPDVSFGQKRFRGGELQKQIERRAADPEEMQKGLPEMMEKMEMIPV